MGLTRASIFLEKTELWHLSSQRSSPLARSSRLRPWAHRPPRRRIIPTARSSSSCPTAPAGWRTPACASWRSSWRGCSNSRSSSRTGPGRAASSRRRQAPRRRRTATPCWWPATTTRSARGCSRRSPTTFSPTSSRPLPCRSSIFWSWPGQAHRSPRCRTSWKRPAQIPDGWTSPPPIPAAPRTWPPSCSEASRELRWRSCLSARRRIWQRRCCGAMWMWRSSSMRRCRAWSTTRRSACLRPPDRSAPRICPTCRRSRRAGSKISKWWAGTASRSLPPRQGR